MLFPRDLTPIEEVRQAFERGQRRRHRPEQECRRRIIEETVGEVVHPLLAAITISQITQVTGDAAGPYVTPSYTREPDRLYLAICHNYAFTGNAGTLGATGYSEPSESAAGGRLFNSNLNRLHVLTSTVGSTTTGTSSFSVTGNGGVGGTVAILEIQGANTSDFIRQIVFNSGTGDDPNALSLTYAAFGSTDNAAVSAWAASGDSTFTTPTNHTETYDPGTANAALGVFYDVGSPSTTPSSTNSSAFLDLAAVGIEINVAAGGQSVSIGLNTETDTAQAMGKSKSRAIGLNSETDTSQAMGRNKSRAIGLPVETDSALGMVWTKAFTLGLNTESDTAQAMGRNKSAAIGLTSETDTAQPFTHTWARAIGLATETDTALPMSSSDVTNVPVAQATETDSAFSITWTKSKALGLSAEVDSAQAMGRSKSAAIGLATETDSALGMNRARLLAIGLGSETDSALAMTHTRARTLGLAEETDTALPLVQPASTVRRIVFGSFSARSSTASIAAVRTIQSDVVQ